MYLSLAATLAFFVVKAIGLQQLAKSKQIGHSWLAWIPGLNQWLICKMAGPHRMIGGLETDHLFLLMMTGSSLTSLLFKHRTPLTIKLMLAIGLLVIYFTYVMYRDFYGKVLGKTKIAALAAMVVAPLDAIWIYSYRQCEAD